MNIPAPDPILPIVNENGTMKDSFRSFTYLITFLPVIIGTGSPEGVISANVSRLYMDDSGGAGTILYVKKLTDIGGNTTMGWIAV